MRSVSIPEILFMLALAGSTASVLASTQMNADTTGNILAVQSIIFPGLLLTFSVRILQNRKHRADLLPALLFFVFALLSFIAEQIWSYSGQILKIDQFPSIADAIWLVSYAIFFVFLLGLVLPMRQHLSKKTTIAALALSSSYLIPSVIIAIGAGYADFDLGVALLYPIFDAAILVPAILGFLLFRKSRSPLWALLLAFMLFVVTDTYYLFLEINDAYYAGHPLWLGYEFGYILMAYGAFKQSRIMKDSASAVTDDLKKTIDPNAKEKFLFSTPIIIAIAMSVLSLSLLQIYRFEHLSTAEFMVFTPLMMLGIGVIVSLSIVAALIGNKFLKLKSTLEQAQGITQDIDHKMEYQAHSESQLFAIKTKLDKMEKTGKQTTTIIIMASVAVMALLAFYMMTSVISQPTLLTSGRYLLEDVSGIEMQEWAVWYLAEDEPIHVSIINARLLPSDKINSIKNAIYSERTFVATHNGVGHTYYEGWTGALKSIEKDTVVRVPKSFEIHETDIPDGEIVIILSPKKDVDGALGYTRSIADSAQHQLLKSFITVYDVEHLENAQLASIVRHEVGHALGIQHRTIHSDIAYSGLDPEMHYVSECDVDSIISLYDEQKTEYRC